MEGTQFGKYRLIELLGRGGMGEVWRAHDDVIDRIVAIKILSTEISRDTSFQQRFRREAHSTARLNNPHVIPIHTHGEIDGRLFVDMRLIEGQDLQSILNRGPLPPARAVYIIEQVAKALHASHAAGLLHRDVKPSNVLLDHDDFAYLIDFGIARAADELGLTAAGDVIGTFHYMAPERFGNDAHLADARSDIYSLACVLYECLTAQHPFPGDSLEQQITNHLVTPPPRPSSVDPRLPRGFDAVIARGMAKNPDARYATAVELARAARDALRTPVITAQAARAQTEAVHVQPPGFPTPPPHPAVQPTGFPTPPPHPAVDPQALRTPPRPWWRGKGFVISAAAVVTIGVVATAAIMVFGDRGSKSVASTQTVLPFTDLKTPQGVSVDGSGTLYVADMLGNRVLALQAGATEPHQLPFKNLTYPTGVTADNTGTIYVADAGNKRVLVLPPGSDTQNELPFTDLGNPTGITVDSSRTVYVVDTVKNQVVVLGANSDTPSVLQAFAGLNEPTGMVVTGNGTIYLADGANNRVLALDPGASAPTPLPFTGLKRPGGVTTGPDGAVYVTDSENNRVLKLPVGSEHQVELPFTGLNKPWGLSVDNLDRVYIADESNRVLALNQR